MENNPFEPSLYANRELSVSKTFMSSVFSWMFVALIISACMAYLFSSSMDLLSLLVNTETRKLNIFALCSYVCSTPFCAGNGYGISALFLSGFVGIVSGLRCSERNQFKFHFYGLIA